MLNNKDKIKLAFSVGPTDEFIKMTRPHIDKPVRAMLQISKDAEDKINSAGGLENMNPIEVFRIAGDVQHVMNELGYRN